jgi:predicted DNA-binding transcriptional regulator YafY
MGKTRKDNPRNTQAVTEQRAARLCKLLRLLGQGPQTRAMLMRRLRLDVRGFYRDLELLRAAGISVVLEKRRYRLEDDVDEAIARLPFPDPHLTLGEAAQLARGRTKLHRKLKEQIAAILR